MKAGEEEVGLQDQIIVILEVFFNFNDSNSSLLPTSSIGEHFCVPIVRQGPGMVSAV